MSFIYATERGNVPMIQALLARGAFNPVMTRWFTDRPPLYLALVSWNYQDPAKRKMYST